MTKFDPTRAKPQAPAVEPERRVWVDGFGHLDVHHLRASLARAGWAIVPTADVPITDETLRRLTECAHAWEPDACLLGNVTARQLQAFCAELSRLRADVPSPEERCHVCGRTGDIGHGSEHMGAVEFPESICEECWRKRDADSKVLEAMACARIVQDPHHRRPIFEFSEDELVACEAELARRAAKKADSGG